jgi:hypothetical protein
MGGANGRQLNNISKDLRQISTFVKKLSSTNIILTTVPHHYDLEFNSSVNEEIIKFNRKLRK